MSRLVIIGSGESTPTMVRTHRELFAATGPGPAVFLDTPFGFQLNADELVSRLATYFRASVGRVVEVAGWRRADQPTAEAERTLAQLSEAVWAFAGPGSPSYALAQWRGTPVPGALLDVVRRGGTLVLGSAAAVTAGTHAIPVYEIYKVGAEPHWLPGLDLLGSLAGFTAAVIPHYDNAEGGTHDTRFCYLGEPRLERLERELPDATGVLGVDEHTALILDLDAGVAEVAGSGGVTARSRAGSVVFPAGARVTLDELSARLAGSGVTAAPTTPLVRAASLAPPPPTSVRAAADQARERFDAALARRDADGCAAAVLDLETAIDEWRADTQQSDDADYARRLLRAMVVRLAEAAGVGLRDPKVVLAPFVSALLDLRAQARERGDFVTSDAVREQLISAGIEVRDTPDGVVWEFVAGS